MVVVLSGLFLLLIVVPNTTHAQYAASYLFHKCLNTTAYTPNTTFQANRRILLSTLASNATRNKGYYNYTVGTNSENMAYGLSLCDGYITSTDCRECVSQATDGIATRCPTENIGVIWYAQCMVRYDVRSFFSSFSTVDEGLGSFLWNVGNVTDEAKLQQVLGATMDDLVSRASGGEPINNQVIKGFAVKSANLTALQILYAVAQCIPDLQEADCSGCLRVAISLLQQHSKSQGGRGLLASCYVRYELYPFYNNIVTATPPSPATTTIPPPLAPRKLTKRRGGNKNLGLKIGLASAVSVSMLLLLLVTIIYCRRKIAKHGSTVVSRNVSSYTQDDVEAFLRQYGSSAPNRFSYSKIKKITNSFKDELGKGGYGSVYKGCLSDGRVVAVKVLNATKGNGEEFLNEVASIGRTSHVNVVKLVGFCYERNKRALLYDYMPNGSLEKVIYGKLPSMEGQHLEWEKLYSIALGIARGLDYLHRGCNTRILHFDIKPHNILLDEDFHPKISDFGLAKLYGENESNISSITQARGTIGYIAPEVFSRNFGQVSHKSDVYSYGMMILEMVGGRKNVHAGADHTSEIYYPRWLYKRIAFSEELCFGTEMSEEETEIARKMVIVGLWCIQTNPVERPYIHKVIEMLEGKIASLEMPPKPYLCSPPNLPSNSQAKPLFRSNSITDLDLSPEVSSRLTTS